MRESGGTVRPARFKFDSPSSANTHTVETTPWPSRQPHPLLITPQYSLVIKELKGIPGDVPPPLYDIRMINRKSFLGSISRNLGCAISCSTNFASAFSSRRFKPGQPDLWKQSKDQEGIRWMNLREFLLSDSKLLLLSVCKSSLVTNNVVRSGQAVAQGASGLLAQKESWEGRCVTRDLQ